MEGGVEVENAQQVFWAACMDGDVAQVRSLLRRPGVNPNRKTISDVTPLHWACHQGHLEMVKLLLQDPRVDPNEPTSLKRTPLFVACNNRHHAIADLLLQDHRVDPNAPDNENWTPLHLKCVSRDPEVVEKILVSSILIDTQAKIQYIDKLVTAAELASKFECPHIVQLLGAYERDPPGTRARLRTKLGTPSFPSGAVIPITCTSRLQKSILF